ncbi:hypothetical protein [Blastopirellula retiformator]|uniref:Uncharacterized protein n=1 Tax=Blastopirellula retiformator TaxID=2527970 RepID=A0A5C5V8P1_9BACT|nr:hypothetical protein [Blastopirellula retiformator]TWT34217.1 hypothetical protein Enr8_16110 [Blastopirellula retiformator]
MLGEKLAKEFGTRHGTRALEKLAQAGSWGWQVDVSGTTGGKSGDFIDTTKRQIRVPFATANKLTRGKSNSASIMKRYELSLEEKADQLAELVDHQEITQYNTGFDEGNSSVMAAAWDAFADHPGAQIAGGVVIVVVAVATLPLSGPIAISTAATFSITGAAQAAVVVGAGYTVVRAVDEGVKDAGRWTGHFDNDTLTPITYVIAQGTGDELAQDIVLSADISVATVEITTGIAGGIAAARASSRIAPTSNPLAAAARSGTAKPLSLNAERAKAQLLHSLRAADTVESRATAALIKRGKIRISISSNEKFIQLPGGGRFRVGGEYIPGTNRIRLYRGGIGSAERAAGIVVHESKHFLQKAGTTLNPYHRGLEFEAYMWQIQTDRGMGWMGQNEIWNHINTNYPYVPSPPSNWNPNLGGGIR